MTNLQKRILTAFIYFPLLLLATWETWLLTCFMGVCLVLSWHEYLCFRSKPENTRDWLRHLSIVVWGGLPLIGILFGYSLEISIAAMAFCFQAFIIYRIIQGRRYADLVDEAQFYVFGLLHLTGLYTVIVLLHQQFGGREAIWFLLLIVGASDVGAYFVGRFMGKREFFPWASPSKTFEGFWGGLVCAGIVACLFAFLIKEFNFLSPAVWKLLPIGLVVSIASTWGDLYESLLKRHFQVKDSGRLLPGHGGFMDRFDGVVFGALPLYLIVLLMGGFI